MIGSKKLSTIREELRGALTAAADDPLQWLEKRLVARKRRTPATSGQSEVLESLQRILEATDRGKSRKRRVGTKKKSLR